ncbi:hypothetical protein NO995_15560 [Aestuariibaculum sp. M13]|uniref:hypothetical protein n=1 Tax=Aestuariibaculum sp. M13 TaxID=2967132 RepID=UPI002159D520|nr:hypothetical protein [Aestuariibaculum sp. M13]MCR8669102.1 hypothetical protein [Aestuariibaculum sp. M13]
MKNWIANTGDKVFVLALWLLVAVSCIAVLTSKASLITYSLLLYVPLFSIAYFSKYKSLKFGFIAYLLFSFLGDTSSLFFTEGMLIKASSVFYFLGFMYLLIMILPKFKLSEVQPLVGPYLISVFLIFAFFLFQIYNILNLTLESTAEVQLFGLKSLSLVVLGLVAFGVYLNTQTKLSVLFLIGVGCLFFSVILNYINLYYVYRLEFVAIERILYTVALFFLFKHAVLDKEQIQEEKSFNSSKVLA